MNLLLEASAEIVKATASTGTGSFYSKYGFLIIVILPLLISFVCGVVARSIILSKGYYTIGVKYFWIGFFIQVAGIIIAAAHPMKETIDERTSEIRNRAMIGTADEIAKYKQLLDSGAITKEEFDEKKNQLLNM